LLSGCDAGGDVMAYSEFTIKKVKEEFGLNITEDKVLLNKLTIMAVKSC